MVIVAAAVVLEWVLEWVLGWVRGGCREDREGGAKLPL